MFEAHHEIEMPRDVNNFSDFRKLEILLNEEQKNEFHAALHDLQIYMDMILLMIFVA